MYNHIMNLEVIVCVLRHRTQMFWDVYPLEEAVEKIAQLGFFAGRDLSGKSALYTSMAYISDTTIKKTQEKIEETGLQGVSVGCP